MSGDWHKEAARHRNRRLAIDTNLLVLLIVGRTDRKLVERHGRTKNHFTVVDFDLVREIVDFFDVRQGLTTTPHVLAETSNMLGERGNLMATLERFIESVRESRKAAVDLVRSSAFGRLGITDAALHELAMRSHCVLTADSDLAAATMRGGAVLNYNHYRFDVS